MHELWGHFLLFDAKQCHMLKSEIRSVLSSSKVNTIWGMEGGTSKSYQVTVNKNNGGDGGCG